MPVGRPDRDWTFLLLMRMLQIESERTSERIGYTEASAAFLSNNRGFSSLL